MKKGNMIILGLIIILIGGSGLTLFLLSNRTPSTNRTAVVSLNGKTIKTISLTEDLDPITFTIEDSKGGYNTVVVKDGQVGITDTNCPDKICVQTGFISDSVFPIVCLPHGLTIEIKNATSNPSLDIIAQ